MTKVILKIIFNGRHFEIYKPNLTDLFKIYLLDNLKKKK